MPPSLTVSTQSLPFVTIIAINQQEKGRPGNEAIIIAMIHLAWTIISHPYSGVPDCPWRVRPTVVCPWPKWSGLSRGVLHSDHTPG